MGKASAPKIEKGKKYLLKMNGGEIEVTAVRPGEEGPMGTNTWWVKYDDQTEVQAQIENLSPKT